MTGTANPQIDEQAMRARIGARLREIRAARDLSQAAVAEGSGVAQQTISQAEAGLTVPSLAVMVKLCLFYRVRMAALVGEKV